MTLTGNKNLFIIFAPGLGGNHLANIISLDQKYQTRFYLDGYKNPQNLENAHFSTVRNLELDSIKNNLDLLIGKNNVFCSHLAQYQWFAESEYSKYFENKQFICISMPKTNARAQERLQRYHGLLKNEYFFMNLTCYTV